MGRCQYDLLVDLEPALDLVRTIPFIVEKKPGIFYLKSKAFLHFHEKDGLIWADIYQGKTWVSVDIPQKVTKKFCQQFYQEVKKWV